jgi:hypothetical protein
MLILGRTGERYGDDASPAIGYRLPVALRPLDGADGVPEAALSRGEGGGLLRLRLGAVWPPLGPDDRPVPFESGRFRLILRTPAAIETGEWRDTPIAGDVLVERSVSLTPAEAAIARHLGRRADGLVDVEVELSIRGAAPVFPWLASAPAAALRTRIAALLGDRPAAWDAVEAAFLGLAAETFTWHPLAAGAIRPPLDGALVAIARGAAATLLESTPAGWIVKDAGPERIDVNLQVAATGHERIGYRWSFSEFLASQPDPSPFLIDVAAPAPFAASEVSIVNDVPLADGGVRSIAIEVRTGGPTGIVRHEFLPGRPSAARLRFVRETAEDLRLEWGGRCTVVTANGPAVVPIEFRRCDQLIEIGPAALKIAVLRLAAEPSTFDHAASFEIAVGARTLSLNRGTPEAWAVGRQAPPAATVTAVLASGERVPLGAQPIGPAGLLISASTIGAGEISDVTLRPAPDLADRAAYLAVQIEGRRWRTLDAGAAITVAVRRDSRLKPPRLRFRTRHVPRRADGATSPIVESTLREASGAEITVAP